VIVLDAAAIPDHESGARTRLRGLLGAYASAAGAPPLVVRLARGAKLLDGVLLGSVGIEEVAPSGGPLRRALRRPIGTAAARAARIWHSETIPPRSPRGVAALLTLHDLRWSEPRRVTGAAFGRWVLRHAAARFWLPGLARSLAGIVTVSEASARQIERRLGVPPARVHVIPNASAYAPPERLAREQEAALLGRLGVAAQPFLLAVGRLEPRKGLELALAALANGRADGALSRAKLVLVGSGPADAVLRSLARRLAIAGRVVFAGTTGDAERGSLYARAAALLLPSRCEGFAFPVHEALAYGCPVIARDLEALADLPAGAVARLPEEVEAWSAALERALAAASAAHAGARRPLAVAGAVTWDDAAAALAALYRTLLLSHRAEGSS